MSTAGTVTEPTVATECGPTVAPARSSRLRGPKKPAEDQHQPRPARPPRRGLRALRNALRGGPARGGNNERGKYRR